MTKFKIFYSWQSNLPNASNKNFIRCCIDAAIGFIEGSETVEAIRDEATKGKTGSPNIVTTLLSKIDECDLFIADVSLCFERNETSEVKRSPNPNVLFELGYAVKTLGWDRVICLCNTDFGNNYPFDIAQNRRTEYSLKSGKQSEKKRIAKIIFDNIQALQGQNYRIKPGMATHIIGSYDFKSKKVISDLTPLPICDSKYYKDSNNLLIDNARQLCNEIKVVTKSMEVSKGEYAQSGEASICPSQNNKKITKQQKSIALDVVGFHKISETPVEWRNADHTKKQIYHWLDLNVDNSFFDLGDLKQVTRAFSNKPSFEGTDDEENKYKKLCLLKIILNRLDMRTGFLKTFDGMEYIPLAIHNISTTKDESIRVTIKVETGEIIEPNEHLICSEYEGRQASFCSENDEIGIIPELFCLGEDDTIHERKAGIDSIDYQSVQNRISIELANSLLAPEKTSKDYGDELSEYLASAHGRDFYVFKIDALRPDECCWLDKGMLIRPIEGRIKLEYTIKSDRSDGNIKAKLEFKNTLNMSSPK